jgi:hypothetical protein
MSREHCREAGDPDVTHMCGLYPFAVRQIDCEGHRSRTFVVDIRALHYRNGGSTLVGNGLIVVIVSTLRYWGMGLPNSMRAAMAIKVRTCWGVGQWCVRFNVTMVTSSSSLDDVLLIGVGSEAGSQAET